ncbi:MAG: hypothetical protein E7185_11300 [Erysipelotrichaceae bacterium]|nr:hypothetical protein [Erysipelotrichaceae bacterium]
MSSNLWKKTVTFLTAFMLSLSFLPQDVYAQEEQEPVENTEITENSEPDKDESKAETSSEDNENIVLEGNEGTSADYRAEPPAADEAKEEKNELRAAGEEKAVRTIMMYICGSNLESGGGYASDNIKQILGSEFSADEDVRLIVMTGGTDMWFMEGEYLCDPDNLGISEEDGEYIISHTNNQLWEAKGTDAPENAGKLVLLDPDFARTVDWEGKPSRGLMTSPETLKAFINYCVQNYPADMYDLILWNHGDGPIDSYGPDEERFFRYMELAQFQDAFADNDVIRTAGKFDFINFDACLMSTVELILPFSEYTDYYIASPETIPGHGQVYRDWLNQLGENPDYDTYELGRIIVDSYHDLYNASTQDGTLAVIDTGKLLESGFVEMLSELNEQLRKELLEKADNGEFLYFDELASSLRSIQYGGKPYYDLGNFVSMAGFALRELDEEDLSGDTIDETNGYTEVAKKILTVLNDEEIIYARGTEGFKIDGQYCLDADGKIGFSDYLRTSGIYIFFPDRCMLMQQFKEYFIQLKDLIDAMPADDPRTVFLKEYRDTAVYYALVYEVGYAVSHLIDHGMDKNDIDYDKVMDYWHYDPTDQMFSPYYQRIRHIYNYLQEDGYDPATWAEKVIPQMAEEAVNKDNIEITSIKEQAGNTYEITVNNTKKRVIDSLRTNIIAELPAVEKYLEENPDVAMMMDLFRVSTEFRIGSLRGYEYTDFDPDGGLDRYVKWLNDPTSQWELSVMEDEWYAVQDTEGNLHVLDVDWYPNGDIITNCFYPAVITGEDGTESEEEMLSAMIFSPDGELKELYIAEEVGYRKVKPQDLKAPLVLTPITAFSGPFDTYFIPISSSTVTIDPATCDQIKLLITDVANIPDIKDTDGDGKALTKQYILRDIYNYEYDLSELIENPDEELVCIELAEVQDVVYNGEEQGPVLVYDGEVLEEGTDYEWYATGEGNYADVGEYEVLLNGSGRFTHDDLRTYRILPASIEDGEIIGIEPMKYTGKPITLDPEVKVGNRVLKEGVDYDITYENNTEIGTATMTITGKGNYTGTITKQFVIAEEVYSITYDLNGGSYNGSTAPIIERHAVGEVISVHEAPVREGYKFVYWKGSSYQPGDKYTVTEDHTLTAQWEKSGSSAPDTSDTNNSGLWIGLIIGSLVVLAGVWYIRSKHE